MASYETLYRKYANQYEEPYDFSSSSGWGKKASDYASAILAKQRAQQEQEQLRIKGRSGLDRTFDVLLSPLYASAGFVDGLVVEKNLGTAFKQAGQGALHGLNVFNNVAEEEHEYTYGKILGDVGWNPESGLGKFTKGAVGLALDVLLDPSTYLTGGLSAVVKGTGRVGEATKALRTVSDNMTTLVAENSAKKLDDLISQGVDANLAQRLITKQNNDLLQRVQGKTEMTEEMASVIIQNRALKKGTTVASKELAEESKSLAQQYNKTMGIRDAGGATTPITFGIGNMPFFGNAYVRKTGSKPWTIGDGKYVRKVSDAVGVSRGYAKLRSKIYGGKIGELFSSTNAPLFKMSKENPEKLYNFMVGMDKIDGKNLTKYAKEKEIRDFAKSIDLALTPSEQKQVIKLLENKKTFAKIKTTLKYAETKNAEALRAGLQNSIVVNKQAIDDLQKSYTDTVADLSQKLDLTEVGKIEVATHLKTIQNEMDEALNELSDIYASGAKVDDSLMKQLVQSINDIDERIASYVPRAEHFLPNVDEMITKVVADSDADTIFFNQMDEYKKLANAQTDETAKMIKNETGELSDVDVEVIKSIRQEQSKMLHERPTQTAKATLADALSMFAYGVKGRINKTVSNDAIIKLAKIAKVDYNPADVRWFLESNPQMFTSHKRMVNEHIAKKYGYASWQEKFTEPMEAFGKKIREGGELTKLEKEYVDQLLLLRDLRDRDIKRLHDNMTEAEFMAFNKEYENVAMYNDVYGEAYHLGGDAERRRNTFTDNDRATAGRKDPDVTAESIDKKYGDEVRPPSNEILEEIARRENNVSGRVSVSKLTPNVTPGNGIMDMLEGRSKPNIPVIGSNDVENFAPHMPAVTGAPKSIAKPIYNTTAEEVNAKMTRAVMDDFIDRHIKYQTRLINEGKPNNLKWKLGDDISKEHPGYVNSIVETMHRIKPDLLKGMDWDDMTPGQFKYLMNSARTLVTKESSPVSKGAKVQEAITNKLLTNRAHSAKEEKLGRVVRTVNLDYKIRWKASKDADAPMIKGQVTNIINREGETLYAVRKEDGSLDLVPAKEVVTYTKPNFNKPFSTLDAEANPFITQLHKDRTNLLEQLDLAKLAQVETKEGVDGYVKAQNEAIAELQDLISKHEILIKDYENKMEVFTDTLEAVKAGKPVDEIEKLEEKIRKAEDALDSDDALETYARLKYGDTGVNNIVAKAEWDESKRIALDVLAPNEKVREWTMTLYNQFKKMGEEEIGIKRLKQVQFNEMLGRYFPHILTKEGQEYIAKNAVKDGGKSVHVTDKLGFGQEFNQFSMSRTTGGMTVEEINDKFSALLKGSNMLSESLSEVFVARAMKNNELMYDFEYMNTMMKTFGTQYVRGDVIPKGKKVIANYGLLREEVEQRAYRMASKSQKNPTKEQLYNARNDVLAKMGLPENVLDDIAVPMVELTSKQAENLAFSKSIMLMDDAIVNKVNQARRLQITKDNSRMLQYYDKFLHFMKLNQTVVSPAFQMRNKQSNMFQLWLAVGTEAGNWRNHVNAWKTASSKGDITKLQGLEPIVVPLPNGGSRVIHQHELYELAKSHGVVDEGFFAKELGAEAGSKGIIKPLPRKFDPTDTENFFLYKVMTEFGTKIDNSDRLILFGSALKQGKSVREASELSKQFLFDYSDLTHFEKNVMRRIFPYYTWIRKNGRLQMSQVIEQPGKYQTTAKVMEGINSSNSAEDSVQDPYMSDFARDWIQLPWKTNQTDEFGNTKSEPVLLSPNMPFMDLGRLPNPLNMTTKEGARDELLNVLSQTAPLIKNTLELATNKNFFFDSDIANEGEGIKPRLEHIARQLSLYTIGEGIIAKDGVDRGLHMVNNTTGVKMLSYDYETQKRMRSAKFYEEGGEKPNEASEILKTLWNTSNSQLISLRRDVINSHQENKAEIIDMIETIMNERGDISE